MRKILFTILAGSIFTTFAAQSSSYATFQQFDDQFNLGMNVVSGQFQPNQPSTGNTGGTYNSQAIQMEVERLFDIGIWMDASAYILTYYSQNGNTGGGPYNNTAGGNLTGSNPYFGGLNAKVGYSFAVVPDHLLLTPYLTGGRSANFSGYALYNSGTTNMTQNYYFTAGVGGRIEYRINQIFDLYFDQSASYNFDQSPLQSATPGVTTPGLNNYVYVSTLGAKFNIVKNLQLGVNGFYNQYYFSSSLPSGMNTPTSSVGGTITIGLTY